MKPFVALEFLYASNLTEKPVLQLCMELLSVRCLYEKVGFVESDNRTRGEKRMNCCGARAKPHYWG